MLNIIVMALFVLSILYMGFYYWPHSQGRPSPLDKYTPAVVRLLSKMGFVPKSKTTEESGAEGEAVDEKPLDKNQIREDIVANAEWVNDREIASVTTSVRSATVTVRAKMTDAEALRVTKEILMIVFKTTSGAAEVRVVTRVKARFAPGTVRDLVRSDITMTRSTYRSVNWDRLPPAKLPKVADKARLYFKP